MFKELKETVSKELKRNMVTMTQQTENFNREDKTKEQNLIFRIEKYSN